MTTMPMMTIRTTPPPTPTMTGMYANGTSAISTTQRSFVALVHLVLCYLAEKFKFKFAYIYL